MSMTMADGWWKAPRRFLPSGRSTPVLPPMDESTCATSVVGTWIQGTPRRYVAARKPAGSPSAPPPIATSGSRRSTRSRASSRAASPITASSLAASPAGSMTCSTGQPSARSPSATPAPNAAHAPGSETRTARRASSRWRASLTAPTAIRSPRTTSPTRVEAFNSVVDRRDARRDEPVHGLDHPRQLGHAIDPRRGGVEALAGRRKRADPADRVAALDQRPHVGERRRRWPRTSGRTSSQTGSRPRYSVQRLRGSTIAPPPGEITRRSARSASGGPSAATASRSRRRNAASPSASKISGIRRPDRVLDLLVEVDERRAVTRGDPPPDRALAAARQPDEDEVHRGSVVAAGAGFAVTVRGRGRRLRRAAHGGTGAAARRRPEARARPRSARGTGGGCPSPRASSRRRSSRARTGRASA